MNMFKPTAAKSVEEYFNQIAEPRKSQILHLDALIRASAPKLEPNMTFNMPGYGKYHYTYASGKEGDWSVIALASQKNYISIYVCAIHNDRYLAEEYAERLPKANIGKSCIRFTSLDKVDEQVLKELFIRAQEWYLHQPQSA